MRIISGKFKGRKFNPPLAKWNTRPTMDFSREALFNILENKFDISELRVLDLFGGTGSVSLEFVSRGSRHVIYVDNHPGCTGFITKVCLSLGIKDELKVIREDAIRYLNKPGEKFHIIFCDPPYDYRYYEEIYRIVFERNILEKSGLLIFEHDKTKDFSPYRYYLSTRKYGTSYFSFFEQQQEVV